MTGAVRLNWGDRGCEGLKQAHQMLVLDFFTAEKRPATNEGENVHRQEQYISRVFAIFFFFFTFTSPKILPR